MAHRCPVINLEELEDIHQMLGSALDWQTTFQGYDFWNHVHEELGLIISRHYQAMDEDGDCPGCRDNKPGKPAVDIMAITRGVVGGK